MIEPGKPMDDETLADLVDGLIDDSETVSEYQARKRERALNYYRGKMDDMPSDVGKSSMVSKDVRATIKKVMPSIKRVLFSSRKLVEYQPVGPGDEPHAKQATDYVNEIVVNEAGIVDAMSDAAMSALLLDEGLLAWDADEITAVKVSNHTGLTIEQFQELTSDTAVEVLDQSSEQVPLETGEGMIEIISCRVKRLTKDRRYKVEAVPLEDALIHPDATCEDDAPLIGRKSRVRRSDLVALGYQRELVDQLASYDDDSELDDDDDLRDPDGISDLHGGSGYQDRSMEEVEIAKVFVRVDADGDGIAELREIHFARGQHGKQILFNDYADHVRMAVIVAERVMHSFKGVSIFDDVEDLQRLKTALQRQALDNVYAHNNPQMTVQAGTLTAEGMDAVMAPEPGKPIIVKQGISVDGAIGWQVTPFIADKAVAMIDRADNEIAQRTGITSAAGGLDPLALQNVREKAVDMLSDSATAQAWCMVTEMAKGYARMFRGILKLVITHQDRARTIRLRDQWIDVDPRPWNAEMDCRVNIGMGTGTKERDMAAAGYVLNLQEKVIAAFGPNNPIVTADELVPMLHRAVEAAGLPDPEQYFKPVAKGTPLIAPPAPGPSPEEMKLQAQMVLEDKKMAAQRDKERAQAEADVVVKNAEMERDFRKLEMEGQHREMEVNTRLQIEREKIASHERIEREKLALKRLEMQQHGIDVSQVDDATGEVLPSQSELAMQMSAALLQRITELMGVMTAPRIKTGVLPSGKTIQITEQIATGAVQ